MIPIQRKVKAESRSPFEVTSPYDNRYGFWGVVTEVHPEDMTVHVRMDTGFELAGVRVASMEWVTVDDKKEYLSGERHLPPVNTYVFCMCPNRELSSAFVLCSGFLIHQAKHAEFKEKGKENSYKIVENSGWVKETDYKTGNKSIKNKTKDDTFSIEVTNGDDGSLVIVKVNDNKYTISKDSIAVDGSGKIEVKSKQNSIIIDNSDISVNGSGKVSVSAKSDISISSTAGVTVESSTAGKLNIGNSVGTIGSLIGEFISDVSSAVITTPSGPGALDPATITKLTALNAKLKSVFS